MSYFILKQGVNNVKLADRERKICLCLPVWRKMRALLNEGNRMRWIQISSSVKYDDLEKMIALLGKYCPGGVGSEEWESEEDGRKIFVIKGYLPKTRGSKNIVKEAETSLIQAGLEYPLETRLLDPDAWISSVKKHFKSLEIGQRFLIRPSWEPEPVAPGKIVIELDPGAAFGTGMHTTTRLCLLRIEKHVKPGMSVLDLGTGSGILSIAAAGMGAEKVLGLDIDPLAVKSASKNVKVNEVEERVQIRKGSLSIRTTQKYRNAFDIVLANISPVAICSLAKNMARVMKPGGRLVVSGISTSGLDEVMISLAMADLKLEKVDRDGDWQAVIALKEES